MAIRRIHQSVSNCLTSSSSVFSPVSVVKELLDNAIDAKCTQIQVEVDSDTGGLKHVLCRDNGTGVMQRDRTLMCANCTTSKISDIRDIDTVETLGFRGEALFFVSQMCQTMEITTRTKEDTLGEKWDVKGGVPSGFRPAAAPVGTSVALGGMFKTTPVRRNLLKREHRSTIDKLKSCITNYSFAYPEIRFVLKFVTVSTAGKITASQEPGLVLLARDKIHMLKQIYKLKYSSEKFFGGDIVLGDIKVLYILPRMRAEDDVVKKPFKALSLNRRPLSPNLSLGKVLGKVLNTVYSRNSLLNPIVWVLQIICPLEFVDVNIEPEKTDVLLSKLEVMLIDFEEKIEERVKLGNGINDIEPSIPEVESSREGEEEEAHEPVDVRNDEPDENLEEILSEDSDGEPVEAVNIDSSEVLDGSAELNNVTHVADDPTEIQQDISIQEKVPTENEWVYTMLDIDDISEDEPGEDIVVRGRASPTKAQSTSQHVTTSPKVTSQPSLEHRQQPLHSTQSNVSELPLKNVLNGKPTRLPRPATRKNPRLEDMLEPYEESEAHVHVTNIKYASERETEWLYRKGRPSSNLLDGYLMLSRLTSTNPISTLDEITIDNRKKWIKLC